MAFLVQLSALVDELVTTVTSTSAKSERNTFNVYRKSSLRSLRHHHFPRTNQFEVEESLHGLEERFAVAGEDGLAGALRQRREALSRLSTKWTPDILHFLLELSDRPIEKSRLSDLDHLRQPEVDPGPILTWEDIAKEDGWANDRELWRGIDYGDSSDDQDYKDVGSDASSESESTSLSSLSLHHGKTAKDLVVNAEATASLDEVQQSQSWRYLPASVDTKGRSRKTPISEFHIARETLFMLQGLETSLFDAKCIPILTYQMSNVSWDTYKALISSVAECGHQLLPLREWLALKQEIPLLQVFQESIQQRLRCFDRQVAGIQARLVAIKGDVVVSLIAILDELKPSILSLHALSEIVQQIRDERYAHAFRYLELLFDAASVAQLEGNISIYEFLGTIFFECFNVYLRPIRLWMEEGHIISADKTFFVSDSAAEVPLNQIWQDKFKLRRTGDGVLHAPRFLQPAVSRIFTTGKSIVVLKHLGRYNIPKENWVNQEPTLEFDSVCSSGLELAPFSELFSNAFDRWIQSKHHAASATLQMILFESCGLWASLDALQSIFLLSDGSLADAFLIPIFNNLDTLNPNWHDRYTLTEFAQEAFSSRLESYRLSAEVGPDKGGKDTTVARNSVRNGLSSLRLRYRLAWPVQLIVSMESLSGYQTLFTQLLQVRRAIFVLNKHRPLDDISKINHSDEQALYYALRSKLLWFCATFQAYLTTLVLAPSIAKMRDNLRNAEDVDAMIDVHSKFVKTTVDEACIGHRLVPIRDCILDLLDLTIKLEDARRSNAVKEEKEFQEVSRLSVMSLPLKPPPKRRAPQRRGLYVNPVEEEEAEMTMLGGDTNEVTADLTETYSEVLRGISADFDRYLRFVTGGLRGVARASSDAAAGKWDILADMLETGLRDQPRT